MRRSRPSGLQLCASTLMGAGIVLLRIAPHPRYVPGSGFHMPPWQVIAGGTMCLLAAGWLLWLRPTPYSGPESQDADSLTTLDLSQTSDAEESPGRINV